MSHQALSADTEVVLLLCGRFGGERQDPFQPLSAREYGEFAKWLNVRNLRPADLMADAGREHLVEAPLPQELGRKLCHIVRGRDDKNGILLVLHPRQEAAENPGRRFVAAGGAREPLFHLVDPHYAGRHSFRQVQRAAGAFFRFAYQAAK